MENTTDLGTLLEAKTDSVQMRPAVTKTRTQVNSLTLKMRNKSCFTDCAKVTTLPLHFAIANKMNTEVRQLVEGGTDVNVKDHNKRTALMMCAMEEDEYWAVGIARMLLQAGADAGLCDSNGRNALMFSVIFNRTRLVDLLLTAVDFNVNQRDIDGKTALHYAALREHPSIVSHIDDACRRQVSTQYTTNDRLREIASHGTRRGFDDSKKKQKVYYNPEKSESPWKRIMRQERESSKVHKSSSDLNVHQFRRTVMRKFNHRLVRRTSLNSTEDSSSISSDISTPSNRDSIPMKYYHTSNKKRNFHRGFSDLSEVRVEDGNYNWKTYVPLFWHVLAEQTAPSYRPSATPIPQTVEEAIETLTMISSKETDEVLESEFLTRGTKGSTSSRNLEFAGSIRESKYRDRIKSLPNLPTVFARSSNSSSPGSRRESISSVQSTNNVVKPEFTLQAPSDSSSSGGSKQSDSVISIKVRGRLSAEKERPRTATRRRSMGSLRKGSESVPTDTLIVTDREIKVADNNETKPTTEQVEEPTDNTDKGNSISPSSGGEENHVKPPARTEQRKRGLRPDSILIRDRMLSVITEEESPSPSSTSPLATKTRSTRQTS